VCLSDLGGWFFEWRGASQIAQAPRLAESPRPGAQVGSPQQIRRSDLAILISARGNRALRREPSSSNEKGPIVRRTSHLTLALRASNVARRFMRSLLVVPHEALFRPARLISWSVSQTVSFQLIQRFPSRIKTALRLRSFPVPDSSSFQSRPRFPNAGPKPGDFPLGSAKSRAAARALIHERNRPTPLPWGTIDLSFLSVERDQEVFAKVSSCPGGHLIGTLWLPVRWPEGFQAKHQQS